MCGDDGKEEMRKGVLLSFRVISEDSLCVSHNPVGSQALHSNQYYKFLCLWTLFPRARKTGDSHKFAGDVLGLLVW